MSDATHIDELLITYGSNRNEQAEAEILPELMSKDEFFGLFCSLFELPNGIAGMAKATGVDLSPLPLNSLPISPEEKEQAKSASDSFYGIAEKTPSLHFLLSKDSTWLGAILSIMSFAAIKAMAVKSEIAARSQPEEKASDQPEDWADAA